jgi:hypothetical protein
MFLLHMCRIICSGNLLPQQHAHSRHMSPKTVQTTCKNGARARSQCNKLTAAVTLVTPHLCVLQHTQHTHRLVRITRDMHRVWRALYLESRAAQTPVMHRGCRSGVQGSGMQEPCVV